MIYIKRHRIQIDNYFLLEHEKRMLCKNYDFVQIHYKCPRKKRTLVCIGMYEQLGMKYEYEVCYDGTIPSVQITNPILPYMPDCHMYKDRRLCLYYPKDGPWDHHKHLYSHIIPWVHEWILYYEVYKLSGKWAQPAVHPM